MPHALTLTGTTTEKVGMCCHVFILQFLLAKLIGYVSILWNVMTAVLSEVRIVCAVIPYHWASSSDVLKSLCRCSLNLKAVLPFRTSELVTKQHSGLFQKT
jgi:hypothetical protein